MNKFVFSACEVNLLCTVYKLVVFTGSFGKGGTAVFNGTVAHEAYLGKFVYAYCTAVEGKSDILRLITISTWKQPM